MLVRTFLVSVELCVDQYEGVDDLLDVGGRQEGGGQVGAVLQLLPL